MENQHLHSTDHALLNLYKIGAITVAVLNVLMSIVLFAKNMQDGTRYLQETSAVKCTLGLFVINIIFALTTFIVFRKGESRPVVNMGVLKYTFLFPAVAAVACIFSCFFKEKVTPLHIGIAICAICSIIFALAQAIKLPPVLSIFAGYAQLLFFLLIISRLYGDFSVEMNAPLKIFLQLTAAAAMINTLCDVRYFIGRESVRLFAFSKIVFTCLAVFTFTAAIIHTAPNIAAYGKDYVIFPFYFFCAAIPNFIQFFTATLESKKNTEPSSEISRYSL